MYKYLFLLIVAMLILAGCSGDKPDCKPIPEYLQWITIPTAKDVTWNECLTFEESTTKGMLEGGAYFSISKDYTSAKIINISIDPNASVERQQYLYKKELGTITALQWFIEYYVPTVGKPTSLTREQLILIDGLAALTLTPEEQEDANFQYPKIALDEEWHFIPREYIQWDGKTPPTCPQIIAIDMMSALGAIKPGRIPQLGTMLRCWPE